MRRNAGWPSAPGFGGCALHAATSGRFGRGRLGGWESGRDTISGHNQHLTVVIPEPSRCRVPIAVAHDPAVREVVWRGRIVADRGIDQLRGEFLGPHVVGKAQAVAELVPKKVRIELSCVDRAIRERAQIVRFYPGGGRLPEGDIGRFARGCEQLPPGQRVPGTDEVPDASNASTVADADRNSARPGLLEAGVGIEKMTGVGWVPAGDGEEEDHRYQAQNEGPKGARPHS